MMYIYIYKTYNIQYCIMFNSGRLYDITLSYVTLIYIALHYIHYAILYDILS